MSGQQKEFALNRLTSKLEAFIFMHGILLGPVCGLLFIWLFYCKEPFLAIPAVYIAIYIGLEILHYRTNKKILKNLNDLEQKNPLIKKSETLSALLFIMALTPLGLLLFSLFILFSAPREGDNFALFFMLTILLITIPGVLLMAGPSSLFFKQYRLLAFTHTPKAEAKTKLNEKNNPVIPIWEIILKRDTKALEDELAKSGDINEAYPQNGNTPLHIAAWNGYADMVKLLLAQPDINRNAKNLAGKTSLELAEEKHFEEIIRLLKN